MIFGKYGTLCVSLSIGGTRGRDGNGVSTSTSPGDMDRVVGRERGDHGFVEFSNIRKLECYRGLFREIDVLAGEFVSYMAILYTKTG